MGLVSTVEVGSLPNGSDHPFAAVRPDLTRHSPRILLMHREPLFRAHLTRIFAGDDPYDTSGSSCRPPEFDLDSAQSSAEIVPKLRESLTGGRPYALAMVDLCAACGGGGNPFDDISRLWQVCPELQVIVCTGCPDRTGRDVLVRVGKPDQVGLLRKPFSPAEVLHTTRAVARKADGSGTWGRESAVQLAAGIAHDFNNVLAVIHGHATMMLMKLGQQGPHAHSVQEIRRATEKGAEVVRRLLALESRAPLQMREVDLAQVVNSLSGALRGLAGTSISIDLACAPGLPKIMADRSLVEQLILNLVVNARDALPQGGRISLALSPAEVNGTEAGLWPDARPGRFVRLSVADSGRGMHPDLVKQLLQPDARAARPGKAIGVGLAAALRTIRQHQGWLEVEAQEGQGTTFRVYFPIAAVACS